METTCPECNGSGEVEDDCPECDGTGEVDHDTACGECRGTGSVDEECPACDGSGTVEVEGEGEVAPSDFMELDQTTGGNEDGN